MKNSVLILTLILVVASGMKFGATLVADEALRPNILYLYVDDMGWGSIGPNAQAQRRADNLPSVRTPNLDRLAAQGVNFTRGYGCHVCSPARSSQQSGFHQGHTFSDRNDPNNAKKAMRADEILMGDALSAAGYVTGYWGKWGYGGSKDHENPVIENVQTLPTSHGYKHVLAELHHVRAHTFFQPTLWSAPAKSGAIGGLELVPNSLARYQNKAVYPTKPALQDHADYPETAYCDDAYSFAALDFVRAQGKNYNETGQPFFGLLAVQIPHAPFGEISALPDWDQAYADDPHYDSLADQTRQWSAMVTRIDAHFGNILAALEDPNQDGDTSDSIMDNTLVIFQSDNGGPGGKNNVELDANGGLSGVKGKIQEGGIRVPLVMRWPAKITAESKLKPGTNNDMIVDVTDLLPTFCEIAGAPTPLGIDGVSIAPTLTGIGQQRRREFIIHEASNGQSIIRGNQKLVRTKKAALELYDLDVDRAEANDIAGEHPGLVKELESLLLGERVAEPKGFANTYHHWTGDNGAKTSDADNWSDYRYANAGVTYMTDDGAPQLSWTARIENSSGKPNVAQADADLEFLALEIRGDTKHKATQSLVLGAGVNLTGRNEIRLAPLATLSVDGGIVSSLRWIDVQPGGTLDGSGSIEATVYNNGTVDAGLKQAGFQLKGDFHQSKDASLNAFLNDAKQPSIQVTGNANLAGTLTVTTETGLKPVPGKSYTVLTADKITGEFSNAGNELVASDGTRFTIRYTQSAVKVSVKSDAGESKPNIVLFFVDDLGWSDLGYRNPLFESPNIDQLANEGLDFQQAYIACPTCSPSRGTLLTGKHPARLKLVRHIPNDPENGFDQFGRTDQEFNWWKTDPAQFPCVNWLALDQITYAEALKNLGYYNLFVGKWHLGHEKFHPIHQGFDRQIGTSNAGHPKSYYPPYFKNSEVMADEKSRYLTDALTDQTVEFIEQYDRDQPFMVSCWYYSVHGPHQGRKDLLKHFQDKGLTGKQANYAAMVKAVDESVGRVRDAIREKGIEKETIVIFLSDQGGYFENPPFHGGKRIDTLYEGGARVPFVFHWPGTTQPGTKNNSIVQSTDLFPTLVEIAGGDPAKFKNLDGVSLMSTIQNNDTLKRGKPLFGYRAYEDLYGSVRLDDWKLLAYRSGIVKLYNLAEDIEEQNNLETSNPVKRNELLAKFVEWEKEMGVEQYSGVQ